MRHVHWIDICFPCEAFPCEISLCLHSIPIQGVPIKSAATLKQHYSTTKTLAENVKTVLELSGIGL